MAEWAARYGLDDWHEPDNQGVAARVIGQDLDNAFGDNPDPDHYGRELRVVLSGPNGGTLVVNLATVLALAARLRAPQQDNSNNEDRS